MNIRLKAFRAVDERILCLKFIEGHMQVLQDYGVTNITTNNTLWIFNPSIYVIIAELEGHEDLVGGIRVHVADNISPLPIEEALGKLNSKVYDLIKENTSEGTGELCGLWNAKAVAGMGVSLLLVRAGVSIVNQIGLSSLFTICADFTLSMVKRVGFTFESSLGKGGKFAYPNENYVTRVLKKNNTVTLENADKEDREIILNLRNNPQQYRIETGPKGEMNVEYNLYIHTVEKQNINETL